MRFIKYVLSGALSLAFFSALSQTSPLNPLLIHSNQPIAFDKVDAKLIRESVEKTIQLSNGLVNKIIAGLPSGSGPGSTLAVYDEMSYELNDLAMKLGLIAQTYLSDSTRNAANDGSQAISDYQTSLILNEPLYKAFKTYAAASFSILKPNQQKYVNDQIRLFENNGMKLDVAGRKELQGISDRMTTLGLEFDKNIAVSRDSLVFNESELAGVSKASLKKWSRPDGSYVIYINNPNYVDISENAIAESTRKRILFKYHNRAYPQNINVLDSLLYYRQLYAQKLGYSSYAAYALADKMAGKPKAVWEFEYNLVDKLTPKVTADLSSLRSLKHQMHPELADSVFAWDLQYYKKQLLDQKYHLNQDELKEYFEMNQTISGMFEVYHRLFGITVKETSGLPTWYSKVRSFEMYLGDKKLGFFYFDLYPRQNKYNHFACFGISAANLSPGREILPVAALICNFPEAVKGEPTLLSHSDVTILFHEFGHLVAAMVARSDLASQPATLKIDFVEAPSQFLENFTWEYPSLKIFARNYKTGAVLPEDLFRKLKTTQHILEGIATIQQVYYGMIDFTFEDKYDSIRDKDLTSVAANLSKITQIPFPEGTHMIAAFNHLSGYGANYYGYLWSLVFAQDIFSVFEKNGVMDVKTGERYRKEILEVAGSQQEMDMLRNFLGREPNADAFMRSIGL
jgi:thimet oligopeptidase